MATAMCNIDCATCNSFFVSQVARKIATSGTTLENTRDMLFTSEVMIFTAHFPIVKAKMFSLNMFKKCLVH